MNRLFLSACVAAALAVPSKIAQVAKADVVLEWNVTALKTTASAPFNPPLESRNVAIVHAAMFDAVNSIRRRYAPYRVRVRAAGHESLIAAVASAAHAVLLARYPEQQAGLDAALERSLA